jgi:hypothetical protein
MGEVVKWSIVLIGGGLFVLNLFTLAKRRMTPMLSVIWSIFAVMLLLFGCSVRLSELDAYMSPTVAVILILALCGVIFTFYHVSTQISDLVDKVNELNMQVSLLNAENVRAVRERRQKELAETGGPEEDT